VTLENWAERLVYIHITINEHNALARRKSSSLSFSSSQDTLLING
jgi:hypothetical protein